MIAAVPNTASVAKAWASHLPAKADGASNSESDTAAQVTPKADVDAENEIAIAPETKPASIETNESDETASTSDAAEAGIAATERSNTPTLIVAMLMMIGVAFVLLKKMKQMKPSSEGGPLIRPIGTHMLGPKQGLLLVDVAGEMVLLGTTDKGVQLLTKLEGNGIERTTEESSVTSNSPLQHVLMRLKIRLENVGSISPASETQNATANVGRQVGATNGTNSELNLLAENAWAVVISSRSHLERQCRHTRGTSLQEQRPHQKLECSRVLKS